MVLDLRDADKDKSSQAFSSMVILVKKNICWDELSNRIPSRAELDIAQNIVTNLKALKPEQIQALVSHSEWLSEVQIRLYLPFLIQ
jgi:NTE family protein